MDLQDVTINMCTDDVLCTDTCAITRNLSVAWRLMRPVPFHRARQGLLVLGEIQLDTGVWQTCFYLVQTREFGVLAHGIGVHQFEFKMPDGQLAPGPRAEDLVPLGILRWTCPDGTQAKYTKLRESIISKYLATCRGPDWPFELEASSGDRAASGRSHQ